MSTKHQSSVAPAINPSAVMIHIASLLLLAAHTFATPTTQSRDTQPLQLDRAGFDYDDRPDDLLVRSLWKFKRNAPAEHTDSDHVSRKQFIVKLLCRTEDKCAHTQVYEFDLMRVEPSVSDRGIYY